MPYAMNNSASTAAFVQQEASVLHLHLHLMRLSPKLLVTIADASHSPRRGKAPYGAIVACSVPASVSCCVLQQHPLATLAFY